MKSLPLLTSAIALIFAAPAMAWQNNQSADLVLGGNNPLLTKLSEVRGLALDPVTGKLFVADTEGRVVRYSSEGKFITGAAPEAVLGKPNMLARSSFTYSATNLRYANSLVLDGSGRLWVADVTRILRWDEAATKATGSPADGVLGGANFTSTYDFPDARALGYSLHLTLDAAGNLYASSGDRHSVVRFDAAAAKPNGTGPDAIFGQTTFAGNTSATSPTKLSSPRDMVARGTSLYVYDAGNNRVLRLDNAATRTTGAAFDAVIGQDSFYFKSVTTLSGIAMTINSQGTLMMSLAPPLGAATLTAWANVDSLSGLMPAPLYSVPAAFTSLLAESGGRLWVATAQGVERYENFPAQTTPAGILGTSPPSGLAAPWQAAVDPVTGKVFVTDTDRHVMVRYASVSSLASHAPSEAIFGGGTTAAATSLNYPRGLCFDSAGRLWVADSGSNRVLRWNYPATMPSYSPADGVIGQPNFTTGGVVSPNEVVVREPYGVTVDASGTLWVLDYGWARVLRFDNAATKSGYVPADGILGKDDYYSGTSSGLPGRFYQATRIQSDHLGRLWIMDTGGVNEAGGDLGSDIRLFRYDTPKTGAPGAPPTLTIKFNYGVSSANAAHAFAVTPDDTLWIASHRASPRISRYNSAAAVTTGSVPDGQLGTGVSGAGGTEFGGGLNALSTDAAGNLWAADPVNRRVMRFSKIIPNSPAPPGTAIFAGRDALGFQLQFTAVPGSSYFMETSPDLQTWMQTGTAFPAVTSVETLTDPAPSGPRRFYRARLVE